MGNTSSSSATSKLRRDSSLISRPRALGTFSSPRSRAEPLGPEYIISPFPKPSTTSQHPIASHTASQHSLVTSTPQNLKHRRSQTFAASQTSLRSTEATADVRRSRSANAAVLSRADRSSDFLGAPPPYSLEDASSSNLHSETHDGYLDVPGSSHWTKGHRRAVSDLTPGERRDTTMQVDGTDYEGTLPEEFGYGVGDGIRAGSGHTRLVMLPPSTSSLTSSSRGDFVSSPTSSIPSVQNKEDPLELLKQYKTIFIIDDSNSMAGERWAETREALASLAETAAKYDTDGIDAYFLNANRSAQNMRSAASVKRQFDSVEPQGISLLAKKLEELLHDYISELERAQREILRGDLRALQRVKPVNYIIITDGVPTDDPEAVIIQAARRLDRGNLPVSQIGIQFVQVGDDPRATEALQELDDGLAKEYGIRDMVDTTPYSGGPLDSELLIKILLGGINRRVDKKGARSVLP